MAAEYSSISPSSQCQVTYIGDAAERADGRRPVQVLLAGHILSQRRRHDDDVIGHTGQLLDAEVDEAAECHVLGLEQLGHGEEGLCRLGGAQLFSLHVRTAGTGQDRAHRSGKRRSGQGSTSNIHIQLRTELYGSDSIQVRTVLHGSDSQVITRSQVSGRCAGLFTPIVLTIYDSAFNLVRNMNAYLL